MTLEQLRIFLAVAEMLHFTRAAEALYITQPAVSAAIQTLETEYGVRLFHRIGRHIEITDAGKLLQGEAQKILDHVQLTERGLKELNNLQRGELKIGASLTVGNYWLPEKISQFKQLYPGIFINCQLGNAEEICEGTAVGMYDLGLVTGDIKPSLQQSLEQDEVGSDRLQIVVGKSHPWYQSAEIYLDELFSTSWVMRESGSGAQQMFEQALQSWGIEPSNLDVVLNLNTSEMVKAVVESGVGAAALPESMVKKELQLGTLHAVQITNPKKQSKKELEILQPIWKLKHRQRFHTRVMIAFENMLMQKNVQAA
ncbi:LysR substrate-binding domain-containing protein [Nostoc sp. UIC 10607]|uniref:LysR family transcriptional regulator n=2 Tax=Nostoc TaxID=1177 RepID=A0ABR8IFF4_9NOSO|nr:MULTISPECIES: LysR substrate-binding domain-containing protein [Nostoc]MBD2565174.1 LysR family transcriptional regulator [Nostoc linckia FACHB-391]MBD2649592.1 LysR family transcriptional regulator [Nostoc foliaceum FACHB-393]MBG1244278.1 LysR family transcriptional regulator [Nostoc sp. NZL]